jgi:hypothetical protein
MLANSSLAVSPTSNEVPAVWLPRLATVKLAAAAALTVKLAEVPLSAPSLTVRIVL